MSHQSKRDKSGHNENRKCRALEDSSTFGHLGLESGSIHAVLQLKALQKEGGYLASNEHAFVWGLCPSQHLTGDE